MAIIGKKGIIGGVKKVLTTKLTQVKLPTPAPAPAPKPVVKKVELPVDNFRELTKEQEIETTRNWYGNHTITLSNNIKVSIVGCATGCGLMQLYNITPLLNAIHKCGTEDDRKVIVKDFLDKLSKYLKLKGMLCSAFMFTLGDTYDVYRKIAQEYLRTPILKTYNNKQHGKSYNQTIFILDLDEHDTTKN